MSEMFEAVNKGFGTVRCEPVLSESPSETALVGVLLAKAIAAETGETYRQVERRVNERVRYEREAVERRRAVQAWESAHHAPYECRGCRHLREGRWSSCEAAAPELFCSVHNTGAWEVVADYR